jgi:hypothetical protein
MAPALAFLGWLVFRPGVAPPEASDEVDVVEPSPTATEAPLAPAEEISSTPPPQVESATPSSEANPAPPSPTPPTSSSTGAAAAVQPPANPPPAAPELRVASVVLSPPTLVLQVGAGADLRVQVTGTDGSPMVGRTVRWSVAGGAARVSSDGRVEGMSPGQATVTATVDGASASSLVTVTAIPVAAPAPAPVPTESARASPPPPDPQADRTQILAILEAYRTAVEREDAQALRASYPGMTPAQERAWTAFFQRASQIRMDVTPGEVRLSGDQAVVRVEGTQRFRTTRDEQQPLAFTATFQRTTTGWRLALVQ